MLFFGMAAERAVGFYPIFLRLNEIFFFVVRPQIKRITGTVASWYQTATSIKHIQLQSRWPADPHFHRLFAALGFTSLLSDARNLHAIVPEDLEHREIGSPMTGSLGN
jgi:hypothetical protein